MGLMMVWGFIGLLLLAVLFLFWFLFKNNQPTNRVLFIHKMILELGIIKEIEWIKWLEQIIPQLKKFEEANGAREK